MADENIKKCAIFVGYFKSGSTNYYLVMGTMFCDQAMHYLKLYAPDDSYDFKLKEIDEKTYDKFMELHDITLELDSHKPLYVSSIFDKMRRQIKQLRKELGVQNYKPYLRGNYERLY